MKPKALMENPEAPLGDKLKKKKAINKTKSRPQTLPTLNTQMFATDHLKNDLSIACQTLSSVL